MMASQGGYDCDPCDRKNINKSAVVWCPGCQEGMCSDCLENHSSFKLLKDHDTIDINVYLEIEPFISLEEKCSLHNALFDTFCMEHHEPCYPTCISEEHTGCVEKLNPFKDISVKGRSSPNKYLACYDIHQSINDLKGSIKTLKEDLSRHLSDIEKQEGNISEDLVFVEKTLICELEKFKSRIQRDISGALSSHKAEISSMLQNLENSHERILAIETTVSEIKESTTDTEILKITDKLSADVAEEDRKLEFGKILQLLGIKFHLLDIQEITTSLTSLLASRGRLVKVIHNTQGQAGRVIQPNFGPHLMTNARNGIPATGQSILGQPLMMLQPMPMMTQPFYQPQRFIHPQQIKSPSPLTQPDKVPLTEAVLADLPQKEQKRILGERLYPLVYSMNPEKAAKITGMLLELDNSKLIPMLASKELLEAKVKEALTLLKTAEMKQDEMTDEKSM